MPDPDLVTLIFPPGEWAWTFPVSHGDQSYWPYSSAAPGTFDEWYIDVPRHVAAPLIAKGGFRVVQSVPTVGFETQGMVRVMHPDGPKTFGWEGISFQPDEDGVTAIPVEAVPTACDSHGFRPAPPKAAPPAPQSEKPSARR
jgi:hypothetical protein